MTYRDSRIIGDAYLGDDYEDDYDLGDLVGDDDDIAAVLGDLIGARRGRRRRARRKASRTGNVLVPRAEAAMMRAAAQREMLSATNQQAMLGNRPMTAGHYVADPGERELYLPFEAQVTLDNALSATATLRTIVQRPMMIKRVILEAIDGTTLGDAATSCGVSNISIGVDPIFNANGVAPLRAFAFNAVGVRLATMVARVGIDVTVRVDRTIAAVNDAVISGMVIGVSADR